MTIVSDILEKEDVPILEVNLEPCLDDGLVYQYFGKCNETLAPFMDELCKLNGWKRPVPKKANSS